MHTDGRRPSSRKQFKQQRQQRQRQRRVKNKLTFNPQFSREFRFIQFVYTVRNISKKKCKIASKFEKEISKIGRRIIHEHTECGYFTLLCNFFYYSTFIHCSNSDFLISWFIPRDTGLWRNNLLDVISFSYRSYQQFDMQMRRKGQFCFLLTLSPRLCAFLNKGIFGSELNSKFHGCCSSECIRPINWEGIGYPFS